jgi:hypothetical protein
MYLSHSLINEDWLIAISVNVVFYYDVGVNYLFNENEIIEHSRKFVYKFVLMKPQTS